MKTLLIFGFVAWLLPYVMRYKPPKIDEEWRRVPPPNWACRRGGRDFL